MTAGMIEVDLRGGLISFEGMPGVLQLQGEKATKSEKFREAYGS